MDTPDFLNEYFVNVAERTSGILNVNDYDYPMLYEGVHNIFDFTPPVIEDMYAYSAHGSCGMRTDKGYDAAPNSAASQNGWTWGVYQGCG